MRSKDAAYKAMTSTVLKPVENDYIRRVWSRTGVDSSEAQKTLDSSEELQITTVGRKTHREYSTPVWFVREGKTIFLLPVKGSKNQWYRNMLKSNRIKISSGELSLVLSARPITDSKRVESVIEKFRKKHGTGDVTRYYSVFDSAVELTLP